MLGLRPPTGMDPRMRFFWLGIMNDAVGRWRPSWRHPREMRSTHDDVESERELELVLADELDEGVGDELRLGLLGGGRVATHRPSESLGGLLGGAAAGDQRSAGHLERRHGGHVCPGVCADPVWWRELSRRGAYLAVPGPIEPEWKRVDIERKQDRIFRPIRSRLGIVQEIQLKPSFS